MATIQRRLPFAGFAIVFCATCAWAQPKILQGDIPFPFHVGERQFNAGNYDVRVGEPFRFAITIISRTGWESAVTQILNDEIQDPAAPQAKLVFNKYGADEYFLSQVWYPWYSNSMKLLKSPHEVVTSKLVTGLRPEKVVIWAAVRLP